MERAGLDFSEALRLLRHGGRINRARWNGKGQHLGLQPQTQSSLPYIYIETAGGKRVPWVASQTDLLADDWAWWSAP